MADGDLDVTRGRWRWPIISTGVLVAVVLGGIGFQSVSAARARARARKAVERDYANLMRCLVGDAPIDESPTTRYREIWTATAPHQQAPDAWPYRCDRWSDKLMDDAGRAHDKRHGALLVDVGAALHVIVIDRGALDVAALAAAAAKANLASVAADATVPAAPDAPSFAPAAETDLPEISDGIWSPTNRTLWFVSETSNARFPTICPIVPDAGGAALAKLGDCMKVEKTIPWAPGRLVRLGHAADGARLPIILEPPTDEHADLTLAPGVWRLGDPKQAVAGAVLDAFAWNDTTLDVVERDPKGLMLERHRDATTSRIVIPANASADGLHLLLDGNALYYTDATKDGVHARVIPLDAAKDPSPADSVDLGVVTDLPRFAACAAGSVRAVIANRTLHVSLGGTWTSAPLPETFPHLRCEDASVVVTWNTKGTIERIRCEGGACHDVEAFAIKSPMLDPYNDVDGADLDGKIVATWLPDAGADGGPRLRFSPADKFDRSIDRVLYDDASHHGPTLKQPTIYDGRGAALLLFHEYSAATTTMVALRIDANGTLTELR
jgi:hypothetical protein